jgi:hypothetical protein
VKGSQVKWGRWFSFFDVGQDFRRDWSARLVPMFSKGFRAGWWPNLHASPLSEAPQQDAALAGGLGFEAPAAEQAAGDDDAAAPPRTVRESNAAIRKLRSTAKNTLHLTCMIMSNMQSRPQLPARLGGAVRASPNAFSVVVAYAQLARLMLSVCSRAWCR